MLSKRKTLNLIFASLMFYPSLSISYGQIQNLEKPNQSTTKQHTIQASPELIELQLGKSIEKELKGGETRSYSLQLEKGQYLELAVEQKGIDVVVAVYDPDNQKVYELDSPNGTIGIEPVYLVAAIAGDYQLEVRSDDKKAELGK